MENPIRAGGLVSLIAAIIERLARVRHPVVGIGTASCGRRAEEPSATAMSASLMAVIIAWAAHDPVMRVSYR